MSQYSSTTGWSSPTTIQSVAIWAYPQLEINNAGNIIIAWQDQIDTTTQTSNVSMIYSANGTSWTDEIAISNNMYQYSLGVKLDAAGDAFVTWQAPTDDGDFNIVASHYNANSGWSQTASVSHISASLSSRPSLAITANGSAHVIWAESYPSPIWTNHYTAGSGWAEPSVIETDETSHMKKPQIGLSQNGDAIAI